MTTAYRTWRVQEDPGPELVSRFVPMRWKSATLKADCYRDLPTPFRMSSRTLQAPHVPPHPACGCGIFVESVPDLEFPCLDYRGVTGLVTCSGPIVSNPGNGRRVGRVDIRALGIYEHSSRRHRRALETIADRLGVELMDQRMLVAAAAGYEPDRVALTTGAND